MNARQAALTVLGKVVGGAYLSLELKNALRPDMSPEDRRFATALVSIALENIYRVDYVIDRFTQGKRLHTVIRNILRLGVCQLMFFESVPASAAVNESVKLAEKVGKRQLKGFVNATLRNISENLGSIRYPDREADPAGFLHVFYSYPKWLCEKYIADYGGEFAEQMLAYDGDPSLTCVRLNMARRQRPPDHFLPGRYLEDAYYIKNAAGIESMPLFKKGEIAVQGEASMLCVRAAGIGRDDRVLDACAAPGGKSAYAAQLASGGSVLGVDIHPHRVRLMEETFARLGTQNARARAGDMTAADPILADTFDVVLVDAPCSALGLLHRKPDLRLNKKPEDLPALAAVQRKILGTCAAYVRPGGTLLYSTCTIDRLENEQNARWFLENHGDFTEAELKNDLPSALMHRAEGGTLQLFPHIDGIDGFFIAKFRRTGN